MRYIAVATLCLSCIVYGALLSYSTMQHQLERDCLMSREITILDHRYTCDLIVEPRK